MLEKMLNNNEIGEFLIKRIKISKPQLDTLLITLSNKDAHSLNKIILQRDKGIVSKGSFSRTLKQAKKNVEISLYTLIILEYFSIIEKNQIINLIKIGSNLKKISDNNIVNDKVNIILDQISFAISNIYDKK
jgi:hypothetical protein|tara:strand:- start:2728 stop:3123 length:396 start_codon:yes stop_codon:yes gene_type:complete